MNNVFNEQRHPQRRKDDREKRQHIENYWDLSGNQGQIYIIPSGGVADVLDSATNSVTPMNDDKSTHE